MLDEPDVYLHADLQRRLVQLVESVSAQTILASHSAEVVTQAPRSNIAWIDKSRRSALYVKKESILEELTENLGSQFNLSLAKAMSARAVLMVEGNDLQVLTRIARTIGTQSIVNQDHLAVVSLTGYSNHRHAAPFSWLIRDLLQNSVKPFVILDRDYRPDAEVDRVLTDMAANDIAAHVWHRKELESYLLNPDTIARASGLQSSMVIEMLADSASQMESEVFSRMLNEQIQLKKPAGINIATIAQVFKDEFDIKWSNANWRLFVCPPKGLIRSLNQQIEGVGGNTVSINQLARIIREDEIPNEMKEVLRSVESMVSHAT